MGQDLVYAPAGHDVPAQEDGYGEKGHSALHGEFFLVAVCLNSITNDPWNSIRQLKLSSLIQSPATFLACPKKGGAKEGHPATILIGRPRYISETRASPSDSLKCLTLGLGRMTGMFAWGEDQRLEKLLPKIPHVPGAALRDFGAPVLA